MKVQDIGGAALDEASGKLTWLLAMPAGAIRRFPVVFMVDAPAGKPNNLREGRRIRNPKFR